MFIKYSIVIIFLKYKLYQKYNYLIVFALYLENNIYR